MKPRYAKGSDAPPCFVSHISGSRSKGIIYLEGATGIPNAIRYASQADLVSACERLSKKAIPFSVGGHMPGPADEIQELQAQGLFARPYLRISWTRPGQWLIHEIIPHANPPWELVSIDEILKTTENSFKFEVRHQ